MVVNEAIKITLECVSHDSICHQDHTRMCLTWQHLPPRSH